MLSVVRCEDMSSQQGQCGCQEPKPGFTRSARDLDRASEPKVRHLGCAIGVEQNVGWLDVPVKRLLGQGSSAQATASALLPP